MIRTTFTWWIPSGSSEVPQKCPDGDSGHGVLSQEGNTSLQYALYLASGNFVVYGAELGAEFLERRSVVGLVLPAAGHHPGHVRGALGGRRHSIP